MKNVHKTEHCGAHSPASGNRASLWGHLECRERSPQPCCSSSLLTSLSACRGCQGNEQSQDFKKGQHTYFPSLGIRYTIFKIHDTCSLMKFPETQTSQCRNELPSPRLQLCVPRLELARTTQSLFYTH